MANTRAFDGDEWMIPPNIAERVRAVFGHRMFFDPATTLEANKVIKAHSFCTKQNSSLDPRVVWSGVIYMNPPYSRGLIGKFINRLCTEPDVQEFICITNNSTDTAWFRQIAHESDVICFPKRIQFVHPSKKGARNRFAQAIFYKGPHVQRFIEQFAPLGIIMEVK